MPKLMSPSHGRTITVQSVIHLFLSSAIATKKGLLDQSRAAIAQQSIYYENSRVLKPCMIRVGIVARASKFIKLICDSRGRPIGGVWVLDQSERTSVPGLGFLGYQSCRQPNLLASSRRRLRPPENHEGVEDSSLSILLMRLRCSH